MLIALTGYARSGKDTVGKILVENHNFERIAFGDILKNIAKDMNPRFGRGGLWALSTLLEEYEPYGGWEAIKDEFPDARQYLVDLGNSLRKHIPGIEVDAVLAGKYIKIHDYVNTNVYHPEEINKIRYKGGYVVRVLRPESFPANEDERRTGECQTDAAILNNGSIEDLELKVAELLRVFNHRSLEE